MLSKSKIIKTLKTVIDPELKVNIVDLGLIYEVKINKNSEVKILMTLTSPGCPLSFVFKELVNDALMDIAGVKKVTIDLTFEPPWDPSRMTEEVKLQLGWNL